MKVSRLIHVAAYSLVIAACSLAVSGWRGYAGDAAAMRPGVEQARFCRLRFELDTTAQGALITAQDTGHLLTGRLMTVAGDPLKHGANLQSMWVGQATTGADVGVTVDYAVSAGQPFGVVPYTFEQVGEGTSTLLVYHMAGAGPALLAEVVHPGGPRQRFALDLTSLQRHPCSTGVIPARPQKMLWAYYYPWYVENDWDVSILQDRPVMGYYGSDRRAVIEQHVAQAQRAGIDGFISSWWGPGSYTDENLSTLLDVAQERNFRVMINFELLGDDGQPRPAAEIVRWLRYALLEYGDHPATMRVEGRPVLVIWASQTVANSSWREILARLQDAGLQPFLLGQFSGQWARLEDLDLFAGLYQYNILNVMQSNHDMDILARVYASTGRAVHYYPLLLDAPAPRIWAATVQPGYDDHLIPGRTSPILERQDGALYRATFGAALRSDPDWVFITTWNEWWEHTYIEPGELYGNQYLRITRELARRWKSHQAYVPLVANWQGN